jgi:transcriptional regulator with XRE-family HTH domain
MEFDVGARLKEIRRQAGLSQRKLAQRAGVPHGQVATLEQNRHSPSVASLRRILSGVPMSMAEFFAPETPAPTPAQRFFRAADLTELTAHLGADGGVGAISFRQVGDARRHDLQILHERYAPGADTGSSMLEHDGSEGGIVVRGTLELTIADETRQLGPGDAYLFASRLPHRFRNPGEVPCEVISACTPPYL